MLVFRFILIFDKMMEASAKNLNFFRSSSEMWIFSFCAIAVPILNCQQIVKSNIWFIIWTEMYACGKRRISLIIRDYKPCCDIVFREHLFSSKSR